MVLIKKALLRGIIPFIIMTGISFIMYYQGNEYFQVKSTFIVGIIITFVALASVIYDIENWSLLKQSIVHFFTMLITVLPCLYFSGWFILKSLVDYFIVFGIFIFVGVLLWTTAYIVFGKILNKKSKE